MHMKGLCCLGDRLYTPFHCGIQQGTLELQRKREREGKRMMYVINAQVYIHTKVCVYARKSELRKDKNQEDIRHPTTKTVTSWRD